MRISNRMPPPLRGNRLAEAMRLRGWNKQTALAEALGVKPSAVSRWLKNGSLSLDHAVALCDFLNISLDWLMLGRGTPDLARWPIPERPDERSLPSIRVRARQALDAFTATLPELFGGDDGTGRIKETEILSKRASTPIDRVTETVTGATAGVIEVTLRNGQVLRIPERFSPTQVARLVEALEGVPL
jgi:transcriptional regulator with XRE-family HTH domain